MFQLIDEKNVVLHFDAFHFVVQLNAVQHPIDVDNAADDIEFDSNHVNPDCTAVHCPNLGDFLAMYLYGFLFFHIIYKIPNE